MAAGLGMTETSIYIWQNLYSVYILNAMYKNMNQEPSPGFSGKLVMVPIDDV